MHRRASAPNTSDAYAHRTFQSKPRTIWLASLITRPRIRPTGGWVLGLISFVFRVCFFFVFSFLNRPTVSSKQTKKAKNRPSHFQIPFKTFCVRQWHSYPAAMTSTIRSTEPSLSLAHLSERVFLNKRRGSIHSLQALTSSGMIESDFEYTSAGVRTPPSNSVCLDPRRESCCRPPTGTRRCHSRGPQGCCPSCP